MMDSYTDSLQLLEVSWKKIHFGAKNKWKTLRKHSENCGPANILV